MNRHLVISGGTRGLGREISLRFAAAGFRVTGLYRSDDEAADRLRREFQQRGLEGVFVRHDITAEPFQPTGDARGGELVLVHNAYLPFQPKPFHLLTWQDYDAGWRAAVRGAIHLVHPALPLLVRSQRASFVAILSSVVAPGVPVPKGFAAYAAAKLGLKSFTHSLAAAHGDQGVRCFCAYPGFMDTPLTRSWDERIRRLLLRETAPQSPESVASGIFERVTGDGSEPGEGGVSDIAWGEGP